MVLRKEKQEDDGFCGRGRGATGVNNVTVGFWKGRRGAMKRTLIAGMLSVFVLAVAQPAMAVPVALEVEDVPFNCDPLVFPIEAHELGIPPFFPPGGPFPDEEAISSSSGIELFPVCPPSDMPGVLEELVTMTNLTTIDWVDVHFVADTVGVLTNFDGVINGGEAFRIDTVGINTPLVGESIAFNDIFEAGETWEFIVQDWAGASPILFTSIGVGFFSAGIASDASIVANPIPEPTTLLLFGTGLVGVGIGTRKRSRKES